MNLVSRVLLYMCFLPFIMARVHEGKKKVANLSSMDFRNPLQYSAYSAVEDLNLSLSLFFLTLRDQPVDQLHFSFDTVLQTFLQCYHLIFLDLADLQRADQQLMRSEDHAFVCFPVCRRLEPCDGSFSSHV